MCFGPRSYGRARGEQRLVFEVGRSAGIGYQDQGSLPGYGRIAYEPPYVGEKLPNCIVRGGLPRCAPRDGTWPRQRRHAQRPRYQPACHRADTPGPPDGDQGDRISESLCDQVAHGRFCVDRVRLNSLGKVIQHHIEVHDWECTMPDRVGVVVSTTLVDRWTRTTSLILCRSVFGERLPIRLLEELLYQTGDDAVVHVQPHRAALARALEVAKGIRPRPSRDQLREERFRCRVSVDLGVGGEADRSRSGDSCCDVLVQVALTG